MAKTEPLTKKRFPFSWVFLKSLSGQSKIIRQNPEIEPDQTKEIELDRKTEIQVQGTIMYLYW